jgi:ABC-2 type transport system permease protein
MKIYEFVKKIILTGIRKPVVMLIMTLMPIALIFILGNAFDSMMGENASLELDNITIEYQIIGEEGTLTEGFETLMDELLSSDSTVEKIQDEDLALNKLQDNQITCFLIIDEDEQEITLYKNDLYDTEASLLEGVLSTYTKRFNVITGIAETNPMALANINTEDELPEYVESVGLTQEESPSAMDYYGVLMLMLFVLYGMLSSMQGVVDEKNKGLMKRVLTSPVKVWQMYISQIIGYTLMTFLTTIIVLVVNVTIFQIYLGEEPVYFMILILSEIIMSTAIGITLGYMVKNTSFANIIAQAFIIVMAFFGGAYVALEAMGPLAEIGKYMSVLWWNNTGIFNLIYGGSFTNYYAAIAINLGIAVLLFTVSYIYINKKEAGING